MASESVVKKRINAATDRIKASVARLGVVLGREIRWPHNKDPLVSRALILETIADAFEQLALVQESEATKAASRDVSNDVSEVLHALLAQGAGVYEVVLDDNGEPVSIKRFKTKRTGSGEVIPL
ncbi:MAG TPA: hypothetical protein PLA43_20965 [Bryobacteraceae bacterium]|nr:hypothetical protein [Bryobacteraceae bacterium]